MKSAAKRVPVPAKAPPTAIRQLTQAELREATRNVEFMQTERAKWKVGDTRDAEITCACGSDKIAVLTTIDERGTLWETKCQTCNPEL